MVVIFDPQDILTDTAGCRFIAWQRMAWEQGILYDEALDESLRGMTPQSRLEEILGRARREYTDAERLALLTRQEDLYEECIRQMGEKALIPGAARLLKKLRQHPVHVAAVMTDGAPGPVISALSIRGLFDCVARREEARDQLLEIMERLSTPPAECLLATACGPTAAMAASLGMRVLLCDHTEGEKAILRQILAAMPQPAAQ